MAGRFNLKLRAHFFNKIAIAAGTWRRRPSAGWVNVELSLPIFRLALAVFIPWRGADGFDRRAGWHPR
jgi:hypothetical protein